MSAELMSDSAKSSMRTSASKWDPVDIIESFRRGSNALPEPPLPGHGSPYTEEDERPTCGEDVTTKVCDNCGSHHSIEATCDRWGCPRCYKRAVLKAGERVVSKLANYRDRYARGDELKFHRVVMVPPPDEDFSTVADPLSKFYDVCGDLLEAGGGHHGGVRIPHPYRHADEPEFDPDDDLDDRDLALIGGEDDQGIWKYTLPDWDDGHTPSWGETRQKLSHEPHMHCYIVSESFWLPTEEIYEETGWFIRRLEPYGDEDNHVSCFGIEDLARSVMYALSHCGDYDGDHYRFHGALANEPASESQKRRASRVCRSYANHVLGLNTGSVTCEVDVSEDAEVVPERVSRSGGGSGSSSSSSDESGGDTGSERMPCGGRLRHWRAIPELLEKRDWPSSIEERLRKVYEDEAGEPVPPD